MSKVLIIIPAYNEADNIERVVNQLISEYPEYDYVVVNDGSKDTTALVCKRNNYNYLDLPINLGLTGAFQAGMKYAYYYDYDYAVQLDGDGQHNPKYIEEMLNVAKKDSFGIVIGSRYVNKKKEKNMRMIGNSLIELCILITTSKRINDTTSGMRLFDKSTIRLMANYMNYGPEPDTIAYLIKCGVKIGEVQVTMNDRIAGESYLNFSNSVKYMFRMCTSILMVNYFRKKG